ncbi:L-threonylcarbamoyladenylate synthase [Tenacibaculum sp. MAR_2009_124]|uniref:L-threonylcarbamoyladenylate synthase n=1 Tax=Tenacibaculum sp. MAR_2009_124 TaxID=1250059 RepID=UPI00089A5158|nr:L-threonylcarbamoyladenylate synthase [Tenacibaculum sp. MAR_2009_124]SEB42707.1 L-threonylcarbamoyladenylate synthase [Tenacibaculum sp. MAR_2009_124]
MIQYEIKKALTFLNKGRVILYPTDTVWGLGCDATNSEAVQKVYKLKKRKESKSLIILVDSVEMLAKYLQSVPKEALEYLNNTIKPTTIIYSDPINLAQNTIASDNTIAIRIVQNEFCQNLIREFGKPIVSTSANVSGEPTPKSFSEISNAIINDVDYVVDLYKDIIAKKSSTIIKIRNGNMTIIRE